MRFDLTDLRLFLNVVEAGSLTGGAARSHMTLASASQRVRGMEDALGSPLLTRHAQGVRATEAGRTLLHHARVVLQQMERLRGELGEYGQGLKGHVRFMCGTSALTEHLPEVLSRFLAEHPRIEKISFTGGTDTGKKVTSSATSSSLKEVTMELGGKSPLIIFDDADLDRVHIALARGCDARLGIGA